MTTDPLPTARDLYAALVSLDAHPTEDPEYRPNGPEEADWPIMLGILASHTDRIAAAGMLPDDASDWTTSYVGHAASNGGGPALVIQLASRLRMTTTTVDYLAPAENSSWEALRACLAAATSLATVMAAQRSGDDSQADLHAMQLRSAQDSIQDAQRHHEDVMQQFRDNGYPI